MSRYINAELVCTLLRNDRLLQGNCEYELWKQMVDDYVSKLPHIDIVRCEECRYYLQGECIALHTMTKADDFCSYGERTNGQTLNLADE